MMYIKVMQAGTTCYVGPFRDVQGAMEHLAFAMPRDPDSKYERASEPETDAPLFTPEEDRAQLASA